MTELEQVDTYSPEQTEAFGEHLAGAYPGCRVLALLGGLGAGKTALVRGLARGLGCRDAVASPTYAIVNEYRGEHPLYHFDMYRITDSDALYDMGGRIIWPGKGCAPWNGARTFWTHCRPARCM